MLNMHNAERGFNWYAARWGLYQTYNPFTPMSALTIRLYAQMDLGVF